MFYYFFIMPRTKIVFAGIQTFLYAFISNVFFASIYTPKMVLFLFILITVIEVYFFKLSCKHEEKNKDD